MRSVFRILVVLGLILSSTPQIVNAQQQDVELVNSADILKEASYYMAIGKKEKAISMYKKVGRNDTNYATVLLRLCIAYDDNDEDSLCLLNAKRGIEIESENRADFFNLAGIACRELKKYEDAHKYFDEGIKTYPYAYLLHYNKGKTYYEEKEFKEAEKCLQESVRINDFFAMSHYYLGKCAADQGRVIPAILSFEFYLILTTSNERADKVVTTVENLYNNNYDFDVDYKLTPEESGDVCFNDLLDLIRSEQAYRPSYKSRVPLDYKFVKQRQIMFDAMKYQEGTNNWYMDKYVPYYVEMMLKKHFVAFNYWTMSSISSPEIQKGWKKNKSKLRAFSQWTSQYLLDNSKHPALDLVTEKTDRDVVFYDNKMVMGVGHTDPKTKKPYGEWTYFYARTGLLFGKGTYNKMGKMDGEWTYYHMNGKTKEKTMYKNGLRDGSSEQWYDNGEKRSVYTYKADKENGAYEQYGYSGYLKESGTMTNGVLTGVGKVYHENDQVMYEMNFANGKVNGDFKEYDFRGTLKMDAKVVQGKKNGVVKSYHPNGKLESEGMYKNDMPFGDWKIYYSSGALKREGKYKEKGNREGLWKEYHENGKIATEATYKAGKYNGVLKDYAWGGELWSERNYKSGKLLSIKYYDLKGEVLEDKKIIGRTSVKEYFSTGILSGEGDYENGERVGEWTFYSPNGGWKKRVVNYIQGMYFGKYKEYHPNGKIAYETNFIFGFEHGYATSNHANGNIASEGWYQYGMQEGEWYEYNVRGLIEAHNYYINDNPYGVQEYFDSRGRKTEEVQVKRGIDIRRTIFDTSGVMVYESKLPSGNGNFKPLYPNNNPWFEGEYYRGYRKGKHVIYRWDGTVDWEGEYNLGSREGTLKDYYEFDKQLFIETRYENNDRHGPSTAYWENGNKRWEENYYEGGLDGEQKYYHENGQLQRTGVWFRDVIDGEMKSYSTDGKLVWVRYFYRGNLIGYAYEGKDGAIVPMIKLDEGSGKVECFYNNGKKSIEGEFINGEFHGKWLEYYPDGTLKEDENFDYGDRNGVQKRFYPDGKPQELETFYAGELDGECSYWYPNGKLKRYEYWTLGEEWSKWYFYNDQGQLTTIRQFSDGRQISETNVELPAPAPAPKPKAKGK